MAWIKNVELVAKLQKIDDLAKFIPLYLELENCSQADVEVIKTKLQEAFSDGSFSALPSCQASNGQGNNLMYLPMK